MLLGLLVWLLGAFSSIIVLGQDALVIVIYGIVIASAGVRAFGRLWAPMLMLLLMIPLPNFFYFNLSSQLQWASSALGVWFMRLCGISVYLAGNVIDLGHFQMQVVEACDGLRYLFPLMTLGFIVAYFFRAPAWQRVLVFVSSVPITIVMNSARIATIGLFAEFGNTSLAEGLLHDLQGWAMFMVSGALLLAETWLLVVLFMRGRKWRDVLAFDLAPAVVSGGPRRQVRTPRALVVAALVLATAALLSYTIPPRTELQPQRQWLVDFPQDMGDWRGHQGRIEDQYLDVLNLDDYLTMDYVRGRDAINFYVAYYASQRQGESVHSPRACIPGGGWRITDFSETVVPDPTSAPKLRVNRAVIQFGDQRQLVYYWFKQRDRVLTNEYLVKWYIFFDSLTRRRSDGALVRLITPLVPGEPIEDADERLGAFALQAQSAMARYVPD